jgi:hypothetical protein
MSFDIFFQPMVFIDSQGETGDPKAAIRTESLGGSELKAVQNVLGQAAAHRPDEHGCYVIELEDGGGAEIFGNEFADGCMAALRGITPDLLRFLFDLLKAGGDRWLMLPAMEDSVAITTSSRCVKGLPKDFPRLVSCNSPEELGVLLSDGVLAWEKFRDHVVGGGE